MSWLYRYETKGIQSWILDSNLLRDLAGGSALIESLANQAGGQARSLGATVIQATSGAMTARFPDFDSLQAFASEWPMQVAYRTPGVHLVQAWVEEKQGLKALFKALTARRSNVPVLDLEVHPWVLRTGRSGLPAVPTPADIRTSARQTALDVIALAKERARKGEHYQGKSDVTGGRPWQEFEEKLEYWPEGPVAVLHADGSGVGQRLLALGERAEDLSRFSEAMQEACREAIRAAVDTLGPTGTTLYARPVVSAGDDLTFIVRAAQARVFAERWLRAFEAETEKRKQALGGTRLHGGAGVVIVNRGYPFSKAYELAEQLCKAAKDRLKAQQRQASVLAFQRVTTSKVEEVTRGAAAWIVDGDTGCQPLENLVHAVRDLPRGTIRTWLDHFQRLGGETRASQLWARAAEVAQPDPWTEFTKALEEAGADPTTGAFRQLRGDSVAFPLDQDTTSTPLADALTLRFVERTEVS